MCLGRVVEGEYGLNRPNIVNPVIVRKSARPGVQE
jgi:hypothetical protein